MSAAVRRERKMRRLMQQAQEGPKAGTTSLPDDISFSPPLWMEAGSGPTGAPTASITCKNSHI